jgi:ComEC/Rec2-related protein
MPLKRNPPFKWIYYAIVTGSIWFYALLTGLSLSVTRAALMLTFVLLGTLVNGKYQIFNSIAASAFFILLFEPWLVYSVSFQLSYLAVFGIVLLYPKLRGLFTLNATIPKYLWKIICVSIAAQMATFPLVIYYFHQFSPFFLLSNLFVLPAAALIITTGTILLIIESMGLSIPLLNKLLETVLHVTNQTVYKIESLPGSTLNQLYLEPQTVWLIYILLALIISGIYFRSKWSLIVTAAFSILLSVDLSQQIIHNHHQKAVIVYKQYHWLKADYIEGDNLWKFVLRTDTRGTSHDVSMPDSIKKYHINKSMSILKSGRIHTSTTYDLIVFEGRSFLFLKQLPPAIQHHIHVDYLFVFNPDFIKFRNNLKNLQYDYLIYAGPAIADPYEIFIVKDHDADLNQKKILRIRL